MKQEPLVSIITVSFNDLNGLKKTVDSVWSQQGVAFEHIIIDGGSADGSALYIQSISDRLTFGVSEKDKGVFDAMNKGLRQASGTYVLFMNSGDRFYKEDSLSIISKGIADSVDFVYGNVFFEYQDGSQKLFEFPSIPRLSVYFQCFLPHQATLTKTSLLKNGGGYDLSYKFISDTVFIWDQLINHSASFKHVDHAVAVCEHGGMSTDLEKNGALIEAERKRFETERFPLLYQDYVDFKKAQKQLDYWKRSAQQSILKRILSRIKK